MSRFNTQLGLTKVYQHDMDDHTQTCKKWCKWLHELAGLEICKGLKSYDLAIYL